jgi:DNA repair exonuclease SbcCD ATPase subunit
MRDLNQAFRRKQEEVVAAETFVRKAEGFSNEANQQLIRLRSINMFRRESSYSHTCPLCSSELEEAIPSSAAIVSSLEDLEGSVCVVSGKQPRVREHIQQLKEEREILRQQISEKQIELEGIIAERDAAERFQNLNVRAAYVCGRVGLYLENVELTDETSELRIEVERARRDVNALEAQFEPTDVNDILTSILSRISRQMTKWANQLELEHCDSPYRLDLQKLTVVADRDERPIPMERMGSGENWLGCHLIALLSLHQHFVVKRPCLIS